MLISKEFLDSSGTILDVGGWFIPENRATHVVDLMPWETRRARLSLEKLPGERFSKDTWFQANFLSPDFRLPFADKSFDLVVCGQTVEDLTDPEPLLREMQRVGGSGVIECPSRLAEQTVGIRDRECIQPGHPHHHWILDATADSLELFHKLDSRLDEGRCSVPLLFYERFSAGQRDQLKTMHFEWHGSFNFRIVRGNECASAASRFVESLQIPAGVRLKDTVLRWARRMRSAS